jgi:GDP-L-fucose synthase
VLAAECYEKADPMNLGSGQEISIRDLVEAVRELTGYQGEVRWDATMPDGQPRRCLDTTVAARELGWRARTPFREGLRRTIDWFEANG